MAYTYEEVMSLLGDEAQAVPGAIVVFRPPVGEVVAKHIDVAKVTVDGGFIVTDAGRAILDELKPSAEPKTTKRAKKQVESANSLVSETDDLDLSV